MWWFPLLVPKSWDLLLKAQSLLKVLAVDAMKECRIVELHVYMLSACTIQLSVVYGNPIHSLSDKQSEDGSDGVGIVPQCVSAGLKCGAGGKC